jgi:hypothetical protein
MLGAYPGDKCFDPNRASWLPYIIDNPSEWACGSFFDTITSGIENSLTNAYQSANYGTLPKVQPPPVASVPTVNNDTGLLEPSRLSPGQWGLPTLAEIDRLTAANQYSSTPAGPTALDLSSFMDQYGAIILLGIGIIFVAKL